MLKRVIAGALVVLLTGCASGAQNTPEPANPPVPTNPGATEPWQGEVFATQTAPPEDASVFPGATSVPTVIIDTGGLGATRDAWEAKHGPAASEQKYDGAGEATYEGDLLVKFDRRGIIISIAKDYNSGGMVNIDEAKSESVALIPGDAKLIYHFDHPTINPEGGLGIEPTVIVDIYNSPSLSTLFASGVWYGEDPGTFYVQHEQYPSEGSKIGAFLMELSTPP